MSNHEMNETELNRLIKSLPKGIEPQRDLWSGINSRLEPREERSATVRPAPAWRLPAMAAAILLALTSGIFIGRGLDAPLQGQMSVLESALAGTMENSELVYQAAFKELVPLDYSGMRLAGDDPASVRSSWDELQKVEASLLTALREYPTNIFLTEKLMDLRSQQLQFVKQLVLLEQNNWRRT